MSSVLNIDEVVDFYKTVYGDTVRYIDTKDGFDIYFREHSKHGFVDKHFAVKKNELGQLVTKDVEENVY
jgi:hypothetical protein